MPKFQVTITESNAYVREIEAENFAEAQELANKTAWHGNHYDWGIAYQADCTVEVEVQDDT